MEHNRAIIKYGLERAVRKAGDSDMMDCPQLCGIIHGNPPEYRGAMNNNV